MFSLQVFVVVFFFPPRKNKDSPLMSCNLKGFQRCPGSRSIYRALLLLSAQLCRWFPAESRVKGLLRSWGKEREFPYRSQKSILIQSWPVVYFSIAKINKAIFMLPLHKPVLQLKCRTRFNSVEKANGLLIGLSLMRPKRSISAKIQPSSVGWFVCLLSFK